MLNGHERAVLQFSGGKDSTALLYKARPYLDRITVLFGDTGAVYPHVVEFVHGTCRKLGATLDVVKPALPVLDYTTMIGLPSDIVPVEAMQEMASFMTEKPRQLVQSYLKCCSAMLFEPMSAAIKKSGVDLVLRGSKKCDARVGVSHKHVEGGVTYSSPLWDWSDADVMGYLAHEGVTLPKHYSVVPDSLDCWCCTAHLTRHGAGKMQWTRDNYPELWPEVSRRMEAVSSVIGGEIRKIAPAFEIARTA